MSTIVKATLPADQFALADTFDEVPSVEIDAVRIVTHGTDRVVPLLWAAKVDTEQVATALEEDDTTADVNLVSGRNHDSLFRMRWTAQVRFVTHILVEEDGAIVSAHGTSDEWTFRALFPERDAVSSTYNTCIANDIDVDFERISHLDSPSSGGFHLTDEQLKTVRTALDSGYYAVPRETTLEELASQLDVSHQALSERLRRGHRTLIESVLRP